MSERYTAARCTTPLYTATIMYRLILLFVRFLLSKHASLISSRKIKGMSLRERRKNSIRDRFASMSLLSFLDLRLTITKLVSWFYKTQNQKPPFRLFSVPSLTPSTPGLLVTASGKSETSFLRDVYRLYY